jgi:hypothetical protein
MRKRWYGLIAVALVAVTALPAATAAQGGSGKLSKDDQAAIAGKSGAVTLLVASKPGANRTTVTGVAKLGGQVQYRDDALDYLRVRIDAGKADAVSALASVQAAELDRVVPLPDPTPEGVSGVIPQPAPNAATPRANPYMPIEDVGAATFTANHPTWDGRGTTIGIVDLGVTLDHPSLLTTSTGERKIVDWRTGTDPFSDNDPTWINMADQVTGSSFTYKSVTYTAPAAATYRIGLFDERDPRLGGEVGNDVNRDGNPTGSKGVFAVLWDAATNNVYVDTNQNNSFADELAMTDYGVRYDVGTFGTDNPATAIREAMPFVVQTDGKSKVVNIGIVSGFHGSHVAGITSANQMFGGAMSGVAPGAKIVSVRACLFVAGCTGHALTEGMIWVAKQANVDVINMSIGGLPALNDGNNTRCTLYKRLIEQENVQMFISIGNSGPGLNTAGDPGLCGGVLGAAAYITDETYQKDYGSPSFGHDDNLHYFSSRGPTEAGGFKPSFVASGAAVSTTPLWQAGVGLPYILPPGYQLANGTSMSAPQSAGVGALLVSAAKQMGVQSQPAQIRQALMSSARYLQDAGDVQRFQAFDQGVGLIDVNAAWDLLKTNLKPVDITSSVPVNSVLSGFLATPGKGEGIYDREGVVVGQSYTRQYTFTRSSGPPGAVTYGATWLGNDGTFTSGQSIVLPRGVPVTFDVTVNPSSVGIHSAILRLDDPATAGIDYQTMNTVVVPDVFVGPSYAVTKSGSIRRGQTLHYFFRVPAGTPAFKVDMTGGGPAGAGAIRFLRWSPWGLGVDSNAVSNCYNGAAGGCTTGSATSRTVSNPIPGVWEVTVDARRNSDTLDAPFTLTASILGASVSPNPDIIPNATIGVPVSRTYTLTNLFGAFTGRAAGGDLGSAFRNRETIANHAVKEFMVEIPEGTTSLRATIGNPSDPAADLDLYVYNCTTGTCVEAGRNADGDSEESVTIANPAKGQWKVRVDGFAIPAGTTEYDYIDVFFKRRAATTTPPVSAIPPFGTINVTDANALRDIGATWSVPATVTANEAPAAGRVLYGNVRVLTDQDVLVGSGDVVVENVTP